MFNLRYHVASLAAVFLALAVGILLGTAVADRSTLDAGQQRLVQSVQDEFAALRASNAALARQLEAVKTLEDEAATKFSAGRLAGERILLVVQGAGLPSGARDLVARMKGAGGRVQVLALRRSGFGLDDPRVLDSVSPALGTSSTDTGTVAAAIVDALSQELLRPGAGPVLKALVDRGVVSMDPGTPVAASCVAVYFSGGDATMPDLIPLARALADQRIDVVGVERTEAAPSAVPAFAEAGIASVDDVDRPVGQLSAVLVLAGDGLKGQFGSKPTATAPTPPLTGAQR